MRLPRRNSSTDSHMSELDKSVALILYILGYPQHRIAALMDVNQGRISEIVQQIRRELSEKNGND